MQAHTRWQGGDGLQSLCLWINGHPPAAFVADSILFLGLIGIFYPGWGRMAAWLVFAGSLMRYRRLQIAPVLLRNVLLLLLFLLGVSLLAALPLHSVGGVVDLGLGFCMFLPGLTFGRRLLGHRLSFAPLVTAIGFALLNLGFPVVYMGRLSYGLFDNPNMNGRGFTYLLLLLAILLWSFFLRRRSFAASAKLVLASGLGALGFAGVAALLVLANYRAGWLALSCFFMVSSLLLLPRLRFKLGIAAVVVAFLSASLWFLDTKDFGYNSVGERLLMWGCALRTWLHDYFWFGAGFDAFKDLGLSCLPASAVGVHSFPHNVVVELLFSAGVVGSAGVVVYVLAQFQVLLRLGCLQAPLAVAALCAIASLVLISLLEMKFASFSYCGSISALFGIAYSQCRLPSRA